MTQILEDNAKALYEAAVKWLASGDRNIDVLRLARESRKLVSDLHQSGRNPSEMATDELLAELGSRGGLSRFYR